MSRRAARDIELAGGVKISYGECKSQAHQHIDREEVDRQVAAGEMEYVTGHYRVATYTEHKIWAKTQSGPVTVMQLVPPQDVAARRKR